MSVAVEQRTVEYAQERLQEWAEWNKALPGDKLGYPGAANFVHDRVDGDRPSGDPDDWCGARIKEMEQVMCKMRDLRPSLYQALTQWYIAGHGLNAAADACRCSVTVYRDRRRMGEMFVAGALAGRS